MTVGGPQVDLHCVIDVAEVAAGSAIAIDIDRLTFNQGRRPLGNHRRIGTIWALQTAQYIEVAPPVTFNAVSLGKYNKTFNYKVSPLIKLTWAALSMLRRLNKGKASARAL